MEVTREEMLELAKRETFHLDDRLCPFDRETLRAEAWLQGYEFARRNEKKEEAESAPIDGRIPDEVFPFYPVKAGDEFYCTNSCSVADTDGRDRYIAYTEGKTYVSEKDGCMYCWHRTRCRTASRARRRKRRSESLRLSIKED